MGGARRSAGASVWSFGAIFKTRFLETIIVFFLETKTVQTILGGDLAIALKPEVKADVSG